MIHRISCQQCGNMVAGVNTKLSKVGDNLGLIGRLYWTTTALFHISVINSFHFKLKCQGPDFLWEKGPIFFNFKFPLCPISLQDKTPERTENVSTRVSTFQVLFQNLFSKYYDFQEVHHALV